MYIVVGANGFLGTYVLQSIIDKTEEDIIAIARNIEIVYQNERIKWMSCDISDFKSVDELLSSINNIENKKVVFLAAYHNPDLVEKNQKLAWHINITSLSYFINNIENVSKLYYPSTDSVYGNSVNNYHYKEEDMLNPVNTYGKQKVLAESIIIAHNFNVVRYPFLIAPSLSSIKKHFYDNLVNDLLSNKEIKMFNDSYRSSLNFKTGAEILISLMKGDFSNNKILNISGDDDLSKYDIGILIAEKYNIDKNLVIPISCNSKNDIFYANRATSTLMDNSKIKTLLNLKEIKLIL